jgi:hypothetical protein
MLRQCRITEKVKDKQGDDQAFRSAADVPLDRKFAPNKHLCRLGKKV